MSIFFVKHFFSNAVCRTNRLWEKKLLHCTCVLAQCSYIVMIRDGFLFIICHCQQIFIAEKDFMSLPFLLFPIVLWKIKHFNFLLVLGLFCLPNEMYTMCLLKLPFLCMLRIKPKGGNLLKRFCSGWEKAKLFQRS